MNSDKYSPSKFALPDFLLIGSSLDDPRLITRIRHCRRPRE